MYVYLTALCVLSGLLILKLPNYYKKQRHIALSHYEYLKREEVSIPSYPLMALSMLVLPVVVYYMSHNMLLSVFCCVLATVAYADLCARWIPDPGIYALLAIAVYSISPYNVITSIASAIFFVTPALLMNIYGYIRKKEVWLASGDFYTAPSIGVFIKPECASAVMIVSLLSVLITQRWVTKVPLITIIYYIFTGYLLCDFSRVV